MQASYEEMSWDWLNCSCNWGSVDLWMESGIWFGRYKGMNYKIKIGLFWEGHLRQKHCPCCLIERRTVFVVLESNGIVRVSIRTMKINLRAAAGPLLWPAPPLSRKNTMDGWSTAHFQWLGVGQGTIGIIIKRKRSQNRPSTCHDIVVLQRSLKNRIIQCSQTTKALTYVVLTVWWCPRSSPFHKPENSTLPRRPC